MRHYISTISAVMALTVFPMNFPAFAKESPAIAPVYEEFNSNDVNGEVVINIPDDAQAEISITFDSPEVTAEPYYTASLSAGSYSFEIEGRDNTEQDYRYYNISVSVSGGDYNITASPFTDRITVPDANDNPDESYVRYIYDFSIDDEPSDNDWDMTESSDGNTKNIAVHLNDVVLGDIDKNGKIDANDASLVLTEYVLLSTGSDSGFTEKQKIQADVNNDSIINAKDASKILAYYIEVSTGGSADWNLI